MTNAENEWKNSRESQQQHHRHPSNNPKPCSTSSTISSANNGNVIGVHSLSESASVMFAEYNATWDELESRLRSTNLKGTSLASSPGAHSQLFSCACNFEKLGERAWGQG